MADLRHSAVRLRPKTGARWDPSLRAEGA